MSVIMGPSGPMSVRESEVKSSDVVLKRSSGRGVSGGISPPQKEVSVKGNVVTIDGQSFSVAPKEQETFIMRETEGRLSSSASMAISQVRMSNQFQTQKNIQIETPRQNTISEQLKRLPPGSSSVEPYRGKYIIREPSPYGGMSFWEKVKSAGRQYPSAFKKAETEVWEGKPVTAIGSLFGPLQRFADTRKGEVETQIPWRGTMGGVGFKESPFGYEKKSEFERLEEQAIIDSSITKTPGQISEQIGSRIEEGLQEKYGTRVEKLTQKYQGKINDETLTLTEAKTEYKKEVDKINKEMEDEFQKEYSKQYEGWSKKKSKFSERAESAKAPLYDVKSLGTTGALVGLSATPLGATAIGGAMGSEGLGKIFTGKTKTEKVVGGAMLGMGLTGVGFGIKGVSRQVDIARMEDLMAQKTKIYGGELVKGEKGSLYLVKGIKTTGKEAELKTTLKMPIFKTGKETYSITGGKGISKLKTFSFEKNKWMTERETFKFFGKGFVSKNIPKQSVGKSSLIVSKKLEGLQGTYGGGGIIRGEEITEFGFGGISKNLDKHFLISGGKSRLGRYYPTSGKGTMLFQREQVGAIRKLSTKSSGGTGVRFIKTTGKKSSQEYIQQLYSQQALGGAPTFIKQAQQSFVKSASVLTPYKVRIMTGTSGRLLKQKSSTEQLRKPGLMTRQSFYPKTLTKTRQNLLIKPRTSLIGRQLYNQRLSQIVRQKQKLRMRTLQKQKLTQLNITPSSRNFFLETSSVSEFGGFTPIFPPFLLSFGGGARARRSISKMKQPQAYVPSLTASILGIKGKKKPYVIPKKFKYGFLPGIRPIIK